MRWVGDRVDKGLGMTGVIKVVGAIFSGLASRGARAGRGGGLPSSLLHATWESI